MMNAHFLVDIVIEGKVSAFNVWTLWPDKRASNIVSFHDKSSYIVYVHMLICMH